MLLSDLFETNYLTEIVLFSGSRTSSGGGGMVRQEGGICSSMPSQPTYKYSHTQHGGVGGVGVSHRNPAA